MPGVEQEEGRIPKRAWAVLALLALLSATHQSHRLGLSLLKSQVIQDTKLSENDLGDLDSAFFYSYTVCMLLGGWLADRIGTWRTLLLVVVGSGVFGGLTGAAGWLSFGVTGVWWTICLLRFAMGVCSAPLYPSTSRTVGAWFQPAHQPWANGTVSACATVGVAILSVIMSQLAELIGWRGALAVSGAATSVVVVLWWAKGPRGSPVPQGGAQPAGVSRLLKHAGLLALTASYFAVGYFEYTIMYWFKYYLSDVRHLTESDSAWLNTFPNVMFTVGGIGGGFVSLWAVHRWGLRVGLRSVPMAGMTLGAAALCVGATSESIAITVTAVSIGMGLIGACEGSFWTTAVRLGGARGATAAGIMNTGGNIPGMIAPRLAPRIAALIGGTVAGDPGRANAEGWMWAFVVTAVICVVGVPFWLLVDPDDGRPPVPTPTAPRDLPVP